MIGRRKSMLCRTLWKTTLTNSVSLHCCRHFVVMFRPKHQQWTGAKFWGSRGGEENKVRKRWGRGWGEVTGEGGWQKDTQQRLKFSGKISSSIKRAQDFRHFQASFRPFRACVSSSMFLFSEKKSKKKIIIGWKVYLKGVYSNHLEKTHGFYFFRDSRFHRSVDNRTIQDVYKSIDRTVKHLLQIPSW